MASAVESNFEEHLIEVNLAGARLGYLLSAVLMPAGIILDWVTQPQHLLEFLWIRTATSLVALGLLAATFLPSVRRYAMIWGAGPPLVCGTGIELMILSINGYASPYYAGLNLCILAVGVLYTWPWRFAFTVCVGVVSLWLVPTLPLLVTGSVDASLFFNNLYFLSLTAVIAVASAVLRYRAAKRQFETTSELEHTSTNLAQALDRLREVDRLKNEFFANISHELRTPLTLILAPVDLLLESSEVRSEELSVIKRNAERLLRLIDDLLDLARLEVGGIRLQMARLDLDDLLQRVVDAAAPSARAHGLKLTAKSCGPIEDMWGDRHRLEIVLTNLIGNALKFTPEGGSVLAVLRKVEAGAEIEVQDTGPGISRSDRERIFDRFYQVEGSARRRHGGAGIGLALARELADLHGASLTVSDAPSGGASFTLGMRKGRDHFRPDVVERRRAQTDAHPGRRFQDQEASTLDSAVAPEAASKIAPEPFRFGGGRRARILVAEDEPELREFICEVLGEEFDAIPTADGLEAQECALAHQPDLVVTDVMMPGVSGLDLCRWIKSHPQLRRTPVIMLTARSGSDAMLEGYEVGADDFVTKPFHVRVLVARARAQLKLRLLALQLADHARLSIAGTLAAGVAHEIKNPVNAIMGAAQLLQRGSIPEPKMTRLLQVVDESAKRILHIVSALDEQVRPADGDGVTECDLVTGVESTLTVLEHRIAKTQVHRNFQSVPRVMASPREVNQVILNILDNAVRVEPDNIWITIGQDGDQVKLSIGDDGPGVPPAISERVFDPFFTTRSVGEGTGLGLYLSRRIVEHYDGTLELGESPAGGAQFVVRLPVRSDRASQLTAASA